MSNDKKYYWLKLRRDFYKRHDFKRIRRRGGDSAALLYLMMMMESIDHDAELRYSDTHAYTVEDLSDNFDMDELAVEDALKVLTDAEVLYITDDGTIVLPKCKELIGSESESASRVRKHRENQNSVTV